MENVLASEIARFKKLLVRVYVLPLVAVSLVLLVKALGVFPDSISYWDTNSASLNLAAGFAVPTAANLLILAAMFQARLKKLEAFQLQDHTKLPGILSEYVKGIRVTMVSFGLLAFFIGIGALLMLALAQWGGGTSGLVLLISMATHLVHMAILSNHRTRLKAGLQGSGPQK